MGVGVGLDVSDSFFLFSPSFPPDLGILALGMLENITGICVGGS